MKYTKDKEVKEQDHEEHCWLWVIAFKSRTEHSCNCNKQEIYKSEFKKRRS